MPLEFVCQGTSGRGQMRGSSLDVTERAATLCVLLHWRRAPWGRPGGASARSSGEDRIDLTMTSVPMALRGAGPLQGYAEATRKPGRCSFEPMPVRISQRGLVARSARVAA